MPSHQGIPCYCNSCQRSDCNQSIHAVKSLVVRCDLFNNQTKVNDTKRQSGRNPECWNQEFSEICYLQYIWVIWLSCQRVLDILSANMTKIVCLYHILLEFYFGDRLQDCRGTDQTWVNEWWPTSSRRWRVGGDRAGSSRLRQDG